MATVLNPGSFDPIHLGHLDVIEQAVELFGHVTVAVMHNHEKPSGLFKVDERMALIRASADAAGIGDHVDVVAHSGLAVDAAAAAGASTSSSKGCAPLTTSRSSSRWRSPTTP